MLAVIYYSAHHNSLVINLIAVNLKYILFILVGTSIKLAEKIPTILNKLTLLGSSFLFAYLGFHIYMLGHIDESTYPNLGSQALAVIIFLALYSTQYWEKSLFKKVPEVFYKAADLVYPLYLLHATIGLGTMCLLRNYLHNNYLLLFCATASSYLCSIVVHLLVEKPGINFGRTLTKKC